MTSFFVRGEDDVKPDDDGRRNEPYGGNDDGLGITDTPGGLKLQCEGHDVRYRNIWIKEMDLPRPQTAFAPEN